MYDINRINYNDESSLSRIQLDSLFILDYNIAEKKLHIVLQINRYSLHIFALNASKYFLHTTIHTLHR